MLRGLGADKIPGRQLGRGWAVPKGPPGSVYTDSWPTDGGEKGRGQGGWVVSEWDSVKRVLSKAGDYLHRDLNKTSLRDDVLYCESLGHMGDAYPMG